MVLKQYNIKLDNTFQEKRPRKFRYLIWHATCWCVWLTRNVIIFKRKAIIIHRFVSSH